MLSHHGSKYGTSYDSTTVTLCFVGCARRTSQSCYCMLQAMLQYLLIGHRGRVYGRCHAEFLQAGFEVNVCETAESTHVALPEQLGGVGHLAC